ncbi:hypothetical protein Tco_1256324 [Tanacetum coccineum]
MHTDELHKFSDGTLNDVRTTLHDISLGIRMEYLPKKKWSNLDKKWARVMVQDIDKQIYERRLMRNLEKFVGGREYGNDLRLLYQEYDLAHLKLVFEFSIYIVWKSVRYGVSKGLDTTYWSFLRVGTSFDIFQNIRILYFQYGVLVFWIRRIDILSFVVFGEYRHGYTVSSLMDTAYWSSE